MARTATLKPEHVPAESKPTLDTFTKNIGFTPNMMAVFAQSPIAFNPRPPRLPRPRLRPPKPPPRRLL